MSDRLTRPAALGTAALVLCLAGARHVDAQVDSTRVSDSTAAGARGQVSDSMRAADSVRAAAEAQAEPEERGPRWRTSYFPYITGGANDNPVFAFRVYHFQPADYEARTTYTAALTGDAGLAPHGSRYLVGTFRAPGLWDGWRVAGLAGAARETRLGYFGLGNDTQYNPDSVTDENPYLYRVRRNRYRLGAEVTRRIHGAFQVAFLGNYENAHFTSLPGDSKFAEDFPSGEIKDDDLSWRLAVVYDTRDNEFNTHQGVLLEAGTQVGTGGDGYTRQYAILRGYVSIREGTVLAARIAGSGMGGTPPLDARFILPGWEREVPVLGGQYSHRALDFGRYTGTGVLFGNFEIRHDLLPLGDLGGLTLVAFLDAGRVFEGEDFRLTTEDMKVGGGGALALRIMRGSIITLNYGHGPDGGKWSVGTGWMF